MLEKQSVVVVVDGKLLKLTLVLFHFLLELVWPANIHLGGVHDLVCISKPKRKKAESRNLEDRGLQPSRDFIRSRLEVEKRRSNSDRK